MTEVHYGVELRTPPYDFNQAVAGLAVLEELFEKIKSNNGKTITLKQLDDSCTDKVRLKIESAGLAGGQYTFGVLLSKLDKVCLYASSGFARCALAFKASKYCYETAYQGTKPSTPKAQRAIVNQFGLGTWVMIVKKRYQSRLLEKNFLLSSTYKNAYGMKPRTFAHKLTQALGNSADMTALANDKNFGPCMAERMNKGFQGTPKYDRLVAKDLYPAEMVSGQGENKFAKADLARYWADWRDLDEAKEFDLAEQGGEKVVLVENRLASIKLLDPAFKVDTAAIEEAIALAKTINGL
jgi:hypothetical protein